MIKKSVWFLAAAGLLIGCRSAAPVAGPSAVAEPLGAEVELPLGIYWILHSAEYQALYEQAYRLATETLERRAEGREAGTWAVVVDADETLISNIEQARERALRGGGSFEESWDEWVRRREAPALPGARKFLERVKSLGGRVAVVTNRRSHHCEATVDNLVQLEMPHDVVLCRESVKAKIGRWQRVEDGTASPDLPPLEIIMWVGDNIQDFPGLDQNLRSASSEAFADFGDRFFVLPNPLYGSWEKRPED